MADIFLSYKREERPQVERLANAIRGLGLNVWFDASLSAGEAFSDEIDREVRGARVVLACWSPLAAASQWVKAEALVGFAKQNLISAYIAGPDGFEPPVPFSSLHMEDMRAWAIRPSARDPAWLSVLRRLGGLVERADIAEWGALGVNASASQIDAWLLAHGAGSPLVVDAESFLRERQAADRERTAEEAAARERISRLRAEKAAAQQSAHEAQERADAERRAREAEARAAEAERRAEANERSAGTRRAVLLGGGVVFVGGLGGGGALFLKEGLYSNNPYLRSAFPAAELSPEAPFRIRAGGRLNPLVDEHSIAFSPDAARVLSVSGNAGGLLAPPDYTVQLWDAESCRVIADLHAQGEKIRSAVFSPDGTRVLTISDDRTGRIWDAFSGSHVSTLGTRSGSIFSPDGKRVLTSNGAVWDVDSGREFFRVRSASNSSVAAATYSYDGRRIATAHYDGTVQLWDASSGGSISMLPAQGPNRANSVDIKFSHDGSRLITYGAFGSDGRDRNVRLWDVASSSPVALLSVSSDYSITSVTFTADSSRVLIVCGLEFQLWDCRWGGQIVAHAFDAGSTILAIQTYEAGARVITSRPYDADSRPTNDNSAQLWDLASRRKIADLVGHEGTIFDARFSPDGVYVVTIAGDSTARVWERATGREFALLRGHKTYGFSVNFSPDGSRIITTGGNRFLGPSDNSALIWDISPRISADN